MDAAARRSSGSVRSSSSYGPVLGSVRQVGATDVGGQMSAAPMLDEFGRSDIAFTWVEQPPGSADLIKARVLSDSLT